MQALYLHRLERCHVQGGPISGATFGEQISASVLMVATHQLRMHSVTGSSVYVRPGSDPIIEHCSDVAFAPLPDLPYEGFAAAVQTAELPQDAQECAWRRVLDFQYPGHATSPNWHVIDSDSRQAPRVSSS